METRLYPLQIASKRKLNNSSAAEVGECVLVSLASRYFGDGAIWFLIRSVLDRAGAYGVPSLGSIVGLWGGGDKPYSSTLMAIKA